MSRTTLLVSAMSLAAVLSSHPTAQTTKSAATIFQEAETQATIHGDPRRAIALFEQAAVQAGADRALAARALFAAGVARETTGDSGARAVFARLVADFADQAEIAAQARRRLARLDAAGARTAGARSEAELVRMAQGADGTLSPDGRYIAFADWTGGWANLALRDLQTGETRRLTSNASAQGWVGVALVSPDGTEVAYRWDGGPDESTRVIRTDGTGMRVLTHHAYGETPVAWSPDGRWLVATRRDYNDFSTKIVLLPAREGAVGVRQLKSLGWVWPEIGGISPDGRFIVYALTNQSGAESGIFALATDGSRETTVVSGASIDSGPLWTPDGGRVVFNSNRSGGPALWSVRVSDGRPVGAPERVPVTLTGVPDGASIAHLRHLVTSDGSYYYGVQNSRTAAYVSDFDPVTLTLSRIEPVSDPANGTSVPEISPDGQLVAFLRRRPTRAASGAPTYDLVVRSLASGTERTIDWGSGGPVLWRADSRTVIGIHVDQTPLRPRVVSIAVVTGETQTLFVAASRIWPTMALSPDGTTLYYTAAEPIDGRTGPGELKRLRLVKRVLDTGVETDLHEARSQGLGYFGLTMSPDGAWLAFSLNVGTSERALFVMPAAGGEPREIRRWPDRLSLSHAGAMAWTPDSRHLIVTARCGSDDSDQLCAIPREGGAFRVVATNVQSVTSRMVSADGRRLAFTGTTSSPQLWVIRGAFSQSGAVR